MNRRDAARSCDPRRLVRKLSAYAVAGTSLVGGDANAAIIYRDFGPSGADDPFHVDINGDGVDEFVVRTTRSTFMTCHPPSTVNFCSYETSTMFLLDGFGNRFKVNTDRSPYLAAGESISIGDQLSSAVFLFRRNRNGLSFEGPFGGKRGYVGVVYDIANFGRRTGWLDVAGTPLGLTLFGYAYETISDKPIRAGDTGASDNVPGDTNGDGQVDILDLNNVRNHFGETGDGVLGDSNGDDEVNIEDLNAVRNNFRAASPVPEPSSLVLLAAGAAGLGLLRRKRAKHELS